MLYRVHTETAYVVYQPHAPHGQRTTWTLTCTLGACLSVSHLQVVLVGLDCMTASWEPATHELQCNGNNPVHRLLMRNPTFWCGLGLLKMAPASQFVTTILQLHVGELLNYTSRHIKGDTPGEDQASWGQPTLWHGQGSKLKQQVVCTVWLCPGLELRSEQCCIPGMSAHFAALQLVPVGCAHV